MGRRVVLGMIAAVLSAGAGGGVAIASTQGGAHHVKVPVSSTVNVNAPHHCHANPVATSTL